MEDEQKKVRKSLKYSIIDGSFYSVMDGFTSSFIVPYALFLNASNALIGLLVSLPELVSSFSQLLAIKVSEIIKSRKAIIFWAAFLQAFIWLPILLIPYFAKNGYGGYFLLFFITINALIGTFINPIWRSLMGDLVPEHERGHYFGKRNKITGIVAFFSTFIAGFLLNYFSSLHPLLAFGILFSVAFIGRVLSAVFLGLMYEKQISFNPKKGYFSFIDFIQALPRNNYGRFVLYVCSFKLATYVVAPFFAVYLLKILGFSYWDFTILEGAEILASLIPISLWGKFNDEKGSKHVLFITGFIIPFLPILWFFGTAFWYIFILKVLSGFFWGGFNLAAGNFIFDATTPQKRTRCVAYFNMVHGAAVFLGATIGGFLLNFVAIPSLFLISGTLRLGISIIFMPKLKEMRLIEVSFGKSLFHDSLAIKPQQGIVHEAIGSYEIKEKKITVKKPSEIKLPQKKNKQIKQLSPEQKKILEKQYLQRLIDAVKKK
ncbi:MAG: MFS transporter [Candidatus Woesearchaeota archaeon]